MLSLVENLDKSAFDPVVLSFTDGPMIDRLKGMNIPAKVIHTTKPFDFRKWNTVKQFIRQQNVDLIHAHGTRANSNVLWAARSLKLPVIYTVHGWSFHPDQKPLVKKIRVMGEQYLTARSDLNIAVSDSNRQTGIEELGKFKAVVVNNGIDLNRFNPSLPHKNIRQEFGISENALLVLFIARFTSHKQPLSLIEAFAKALPRNPRLHLLMVGDGDQKEQAVRMISQLHLKDKITLSSFRQDVPDVLASADIFVLPSLWEGLPIGLLEAMAMGKPVIASKVDGTSEILRHQENGWMIETDRLVDNLADALVSLSQDEEKRYAFSRSAQNTVNERFNAAGMTRQIEKLYRQVLSNTTVPEEVIIL